MRKLLLILLLLVALVPTAEAKKYKLKFGTLAPDNTPWSDILQRVKKELQKKTEGDVRVKLYLNGALGDERAMLQKMRFGQLTGGGFSTGGMGTVVPELQLLELPFLFESDEEADYIMDEVVFDDFKAKLAEKDLHLWIWALNGWLDLGFKSATPHTWQEMSGIKFYMQESDAQKGMYDAIGAQAVPLPVPDVLSGLQTGLVEAYASTPIFATGGQWFTQTKFWLDCDVAYQPAAVVIDKKFYEELPQNYKNLVNEMGPRLRDESRREVRGLDDDLFKGFRQAGITIEKMTPEARESMRKQTRQVYDSFVKDGIVTQAFLDKVLNALKEFRAKNQ